MQTIKIFYPKKKETIDNHIDKKILWYDSEKKEMREFYGGKLSFSYQMDYSLNKPEYRLLPVVEPVIKKKILLNIDKNPVHKFLGSALDGSFFLLESQPDGVVVDVVDNNIDSFLEDIEDNNFFYEVI